MKFKDVDTGVQCDLNINDQLGCINTSLIQHYCEILPILRPLLLAIKRWARPLGYNNPAGAPGTPITFSSYTLTIMTIGLLQVLCICVATMSINHLLTSLRQGAFCQTSKKVPYFRKAGHSGSVRKPKKGSAAMRYGRKHLIGYLQ